ncbi:unnamed protein product [Paramecium sonneborni]|uniref:Tetratricopeptide repeat protein n=1 Tax=Paramecium sonneborni TaxID=65129 RepID=A0A8S1MTZ8_9CILI|nr:unnamed protein product [Paramecium sonneborni]
MPHLLEIILFQNCDQFKLALPKIQEILNSNRIVTISWEKTKEDFYRETYLENQQIQNQNQYQILENLTYQVSEQNALFAEILITLLQYDVEQKQYPKFLFNFKKLSNSSVSINFRTQINELLKKIKKQLNQIVDFKEKLQLIQFLYQENHFQKEELKQLYHQIKSSSKENKNSTIWLLEQIVYYEKNNFQLINEIYEYYVEEQKQEEAQKYCSMIINQPLVGLEYEEIEFQYKQKKAENDKILSEIQELEQYLNTNQSNQDTEQLQKLINLKERIGFPISDLVSYYLKLTQIYNLKKDFGQAIKITLECLEKIKLELLLNYHPKIILYQSTYLELLGDYYRQNKQSELAINAYQDSIQLKKEIKQKIDPKKLIHLKQQIATLYYKQKKYDQALELYIFVLKMQEEQLEEQYITGQTQYNIAQLYYNLNQRQQAQEYCEQAINNMAQKLQEKDLLMIKAKALKEKIIQIKNSKMLFESNS